MPEPIPFRPRQPAPPPPKAGIPVATILLCLALGAVYLWQTGSGAYHDMAVTHGFALFPAELFGFRQRAPQIGGVPPVVTLITAQFLHGGWVHLLSNVAAILLAGLLVERRAGALRTLAVFLIAGVAGLAAEAAAGPWETAPILGASAGAAGLMGAVLRRDPRGRVPIPWPFGARPWIKLLPALPLIGAWLILQVAGLAFAAGEPVAFIAHGTGFVVGVLVAGAARPAT